MAINIQSATLVSPEAAPANTLAPLAGAGVALTKLVLAMMFLVLLLLIGTLFYLDKRYGDAIAETVRSSTIDLAKGIHYGEFVLGPVLASLQLVERETSAHKALPHLRDAARELSELEHIVDDRMTVVKLRALLGDLILDAENGALDSKGLHEAVAILSSAAEGAVTDAREKRKAQQDLLKVQIEAASAARAFWSQIAQSFLLNLLLPILTALLGYVFASKNGR